MKKLVAKYRTKSNLPVVDKLKFEEAIGLVNF